MPFFANGDYYDEPARDYSSEMELLNTYDPTYLSPEEQAAKEQKDAADIAARNAWYATPEYQALVAAGANEPGYGRKDLDFFGSIGNFLSNVAPFVLAVAPLAVPGIGQIIGAAILGESAAAAGAVVGLTAAEVSSAVGASALAAGTTAASGGSVEDVLKAAAGAGVASGLNFGMGGGVPGAVTGSVAGTIIKGGDASQVLTNAFAAGVGAGVQGVMTDNPDAGKIIGTAARTYIATGGNVDQTLLNTAATAIGTLDQPAKTAQQAQAAVTPASDAAAQEAAAREIEAVTQSDAARQQELADYQEKLNQYAIDKAIYEQTYGPIADQPPAAAPATTPAAETTLAPQTIAATTPAVAPVVTDLDLVKQVAAQPTPTVDPKALERVIVQGQSANVTPVSTEITTPRPNTTAGLPTPAVDQKALERVIVQGQGANVANVAPVQTEITTPRPDTTRGLPPVTVTATTEKLPEPGFEEYKPIPEPKVSDVVTDVPPTTPPATPPPSLDRVVVTGQRDLVDPFVDIAPPPPPPPPEVVTPFVAPPVAPPPSLPPVEVVAKAEQLPEPGFEEYKPLPEPKIPEVVTDVVAPPVTAPPSVAPPTELEKVTVTAKRDEEPAPTITDIVAKTMEPPPAPPPPPAPEVKAEEPKKEEPKKEEPKKETKKLYPTVTSVPPPARPGRQPIITGASPARLLADALAAYRPAGAIEGEESGKERQNVWNEKSLRLKDALGL